MCHILVYGVDIFTGVLVCILHFGHLMCFLFEVCNRVGVLLGGRFVALAADDLMRFRLFVRWYFCLSPQVLSARNISVADSYCNVFYFVLFFLLRSLVCTFVGSRGVSFVCSFLRSFVLSLFRSCLYWFDFVVLG